MRITFPARAGTAAGGPLFFFPRLIPLFLVLCAGRASSAPFYSPAWGFRIDLPEEYEYSGGDGLQRFSFASVQGAALDLVVYNGTYASVEDMAADSGRRIGNRGGVSCFDYRGRKACLMELDFTIGGNARGGWGFCVELGPPSGNAAGKTPLLLALAYGGENIPDILHFSVLDSIAPSEAERRASGPVTAFSYPRGEVREVPPASGGGEAVLVAEHDAEGAQALVDREFAVLRRYSGSPLLEAARLRFYRAVYRDSWERLADAAFKLERHWNVPPPEDGARPSLPPRVFAEKVLQWIQSFTYERDLMGSDFVNLVSAVTEGRGDCDSRAMLWAVILAQANIPAAMMVSPAYGHAMALADLPGEGARFQAGGVSWLVAETTAKVGIGLIEKEVSVKDYWSAVIFE
ncbi:MAG: hypothetical protein LBK08_07085 [Treponema sp.]|jgi:hypothetical protein|nr:hypothetical protein [Treponema sp.]